jgi:hypothetical protein
MKIPSESAATRTDSAAAVRILKECHDTCRRLFMAYAPKESGRTLSAVFLKRLLACIEISGTTANYLLKEGVAADRLCDITAQVCTHCAESCETVKVADAQSCAQLCRDAARVCLEESHRFRMMAAA